MTRAPYSRQRGIALITAMLIVAIVAAVTTALASSQQVWLQQVINLVDLGRADALRSGAFRFAGIALGKDGSNNKTDDLTEVWAKDFPPLPTDDGFVVIHIQDAQGLFNLNNLVRNDAPSTADIGVFQRLLELAQLDPNLTHAVVDWIDANTQAQPGGAEDIDYLTANPAYRPANQLFASVDELRLVRGFSRDAVEQLRPYITALPEPTAININTVSATVLAALIPNLALAAAEKLVQERETSVFTETGQLAQRLPPGSTLPATGYDVRTSYFIVKVDAAAGRVQRRAEALLQRPPGGQALKILWQRQPPPHRERHEGV